MTIAVWIVSGLLALAYLGAGGMKLATPKQKLGPQMAWAESFSPLQIKLIGLAEVLGAFGLIVPVLTGIAPILTPIAAIGLALIQIGAIVTHLRRKEPVIVNLVLLALAVFIAVTRLLGF